MAIILQALIPLLVFISGVTSIGQSYVLQNVHSKDTFTSVEFNLHEMSPLGDKGGYAMPASGCSATDPDWGNGLHPDPNCPTTPSITVDKPVIRQGDTVKVSWDINYNTNCSLSASVLNLTDPTPNPNPNANGWRNDQPESMTTYTITCEAGSDSATVKVTPRIVET